MSFTPMRALTVALAASAGLLLSVVSGCNTSVDGTPAGTTGATGGSGGSGGGDGCTPGTLVDCYTGPAGTEDVGLCHGGAKKCNDDGASFGECQWEVTPVAEDCKTPGDEDCDGKTPACPGETVWAKAIGGSKNQYAQRIVADAAGNLVVAGGFDGNITVDGTTSSTLGLDDVFVAKLNPTGHLLWLKAFGSPDADYVSGLAVDAQGNIALTGSVGAQSYLGGPVEAGFGADDIFVLELGPMGDVLWHEVIGGAGSDIGYGVAFDPSGDVIVTGAFAGTADFGAGSLTSAGATDLFLARFGPTGAPIWSKRFGGTYDDYGAAVAVAANGDVLLTGGFYGPVDFGTGPLVTTGAYDGVVARFDATGKALWVKRLAGLGMSGYPVTLALAADAQGAAVVAGYFFGQIDLGGGPIASAGGSDAFVARYDASGNHVYGQRFGGTYKDASQPQYATDAALDVTIDGANNALIAGIYVDTIDLGGGPLGKAVNGGGFVASLDASGKHVMSRGFGDAASYVACSGVAALPSSIALAGYFAGTLNLGAASFTTPNGSDVDALIVELTP